MFINGSTAFAAYARNLRRGHLAGRLAHNLEATAANGPRRDIFDYLFGGELASRHLAGEHPAARRHVVRDQRDGTPRR
ncbi:MAG TPA: hypothetical protein VFA64_18975 [Hyphomicrobiaceae bacterium]|nr:hypothetical protein [Hyphomicrobiaceae bacterium]